MQNYDCGFGRLLDHIWYANQIISPNIQSLTNLENGLLTQARLILLDSPLMIMTAFTALAFTSFTNQHEQGPSKAFQPTWWFWLAMTGLGLGATASVKWVGLFTIAWVGSLTLLQLWIMLGDVKTVTPVSFVLFYKRSETDEYSVFSPNISLPVYFVLSSSQSPSTWQCSEFTSFASQTQVTETDS